MYFLSNVVQSIYIFAILIKICDTKKTYEKEGLISFKKTGSSSVLTLMMSITGIQM